MRVSLLMVVALALGTGCGFDSSGSVALPSEPIVVGEPPAEGSPAGEATIPDSPSDEPAAPEPDPDPLPAGDPDPEPVVFIAVGESSSDGEVVAGSYLDSHALDAVTEHLVAHRDHSDDEDLDHRWEFGDIPSGIYTVQLDATTTLADENGYFRVEIAAGFSAYQTLFEIDSEGMTSHEVMIQVFNGEDLRIRVDLRGSNDVDDDAPLSSLQADYLALIAQ